MYKLIFFLILLFNVFNSTGQIITLFAGKGSLYPDNCPATNATISDPIGGAFDKNDIYYFASCLSGNKICKINLNDSIFVVAGNGISGFSGDNGFASSAEFNIPSAINFDTAGNIFICDAGNNRIRKIDVHTNIVSTVVGNGTAGFGGDSGQATAAMLWNPQDICFDKNNNLYIADATNQRIRKINSSGIISTFAGTGYPGTSGDNGPASLAEIHLPIGLAIDDTGNLYIASDGDHLVRKINISGIITTIAGIKGYYIYSGDGVAATNTPIDPIRISIDKTGKLVIADYLNYRVFRVNDDGLIYTIAGNGIAGFSGDGGSADSAELYYPTGVAFDVCGNLYFPEANNADIRKVIFDSTCTYSTSKVPQLPQNELVIYPNPAQNELHIDGIKYMEKYRLLNIKNYIEQSGNLQMGNNTIDIRALPPGMYFLEMIDEKGYKEVRKVVKVEQ